MSHFELEQEKETLLGKIESWNRHAIVRKRQEAMDRIKEIDDQLKAEERKEVRLSDVADLAPSAEKAAQKRKESGTSRKSAPVSRRKAPISTATSKAADET